MGVDEVYTLTTVKGGNKGSHGKPPHEGVFPLPYTDDFESKLMQIVWMQILHSALLSV